jgi:hypothetical protein
VKNILDHKIEQNNPPEIGEETNFARGRIPINVIAPKTVRLAVILTGLSDLLYKRISMQKTQPRKEAKSLRRRCTGVRLQKKTM